MVRSDLYREYIKWQALEEMDSENQSDKIEKTIEHIPDDVKSVLCIGVGDGYELEKLSDKEVRGITLNIGAVKHGRDLAETGDMHNLQFADNSFDLIFCKDCFEHAFSHWGALSEMTRVAKKYVLIVLPYVEVWSSGKYHTIIPTKLQMETLAQRFNLELIDEWEYAETNGYLFKK